MVASIQPSGSWDNDEFLSLNETNLNNFSSENKSHDSLEEEIQPKIKGIQKVFI